MYTDIGWLFLENPIGHFLRVIFSAEWRTFLLHSDYIIQRLKKTLSNVLGLQF